METKTSLANSASERLEHPSERRVQAEAPSTSPPAEVHYSHGHVVSVGDELLWCGLLCTGVSCSLSVFPCTQLW